MNCNCRGDLGQYCDECDGQSKHSAACRCRKCTPNDPFHAEGDRRVASIKARGGSLFGNRPNARDILDGKSTATEVLASADAEGDRIEARWRETSGQ